MNYVAPVVSEIASRTALFSSVKHRSFFRRGSAKNSHEQIQKTSSKIGHLKWLPDPFLPCLPIQLGSCCSIVWAKSSHGWSRGGSPWWPMRWRSWLKTRQLGSRLQWVQKWRWNLQYFFWHPTNHPFLIICDGKWTNSLGYFSSWTMPIGWILLNLLVFKAFKWSKGEFVGFG